MTPLIDLSFLITGILIYLALAAATPKRRIRPLKGSKIIVKASNRIIHIGRLDHFDGDVAVCYNDNGTMFAAWVSHLFWSESESAFVERV